MHIVIAAWVYVIAMIALAMRSTFAAVVTFAIVGCAPVALYAWIALARHARRRTATPRVEASRAASRSSGLEREMHAGDDGDA